MPYVRNRYRKDQYRGCASRNREGLTSDSMRRFHIRNSHQQIRECWFALSSFVRNLRQSRSGMPHEHTSWSRFLGCRTLLPGYDHLFASSYRFDPHALEFRFQQRCSQR